MIEQIARYPRLRDRAIFIGEADDIVPHSFGTDLPQIRDWTEQHYEFAGYLTGFDPAEFADRERIRAELGFKLDEQVCIVTVGGSGVGAHLLRRGNRGGDRRRDRTRGRLPASRRRRRGARGCVNRRASVAHTPRPGVE